MYRTVLVDDEPLALRGLAEIINWKGEGFEIIGLFKNPREALSFLEKNGVELLFTDIRMPGLSGTELLGRVKSLYPGLKCVIVSAYSDFEAAREAMSWNAEGYILKPLETAEILKVLKKIKNELDEKLPEDFLFDLEEKNLPPEAQAAAFRLFSGEKRLVVLSETIPVPSFSVPLSIKGARTKVWLCNAGLLQQKLPQSLPGREAVRLFPMIQEAAASGNGKFFYSDHSLVSEIQFYLGTHYYRDMSLHELGERFSVSENYLCELFKKHSGDTVIGFYTKLRLHNARRLMLNGSLSIKEVAFASGFNDYSYFNRSFHKFFFEAPDRLKTKDSEEYGSALYPFPYIDWRRINGD
jgi:two-component system response regulator YesN